MTSRRVVLGLGLGVLWVGLAYVGVAYFSGLGWVVGDTESYFRQARAILDGRFVDFYPNGFPAWIAAVWSVFGEGSTEPLVWGNIVFGLGAVLCTFFLGQRWSREGTVAVLAAVVVAHWPNFVRFVPRIMSDVPAVFFVTAALLGVATRRVRVAGVLFGLASIFRPNLIPIWLGAGLLLALREERRGARRVIGYGMIPVGLLVVWGFWKTGDVGLGGNFKYNLLKGIGYNYEWSAVMVGLEPANQSGSLDVREMSTWETIGVYMEFAVTHPIVFAKQRMFHLWQMWGPLPVNPRISVWERMLWGLRCPLLILAGVGFWARRDEWLTWVLALPCVALTAVHVVFFGLPRFVLPAIPALAIVGVEGGRIVLAGVVGRGNHGGMEGGEKAERS